MIYFLYNHNIITDENQGTNKEVNEIYFLAMFNYPNPLERYIIVLKLVPAGFWVNLNAPWIDAKRLFATKTRIKLMRNFANLP